MRNDARKRCANVSTPHHAEHNLINPVIEVKLASTPKIPDTNVTGAILSSPRIEKCLVYWTVTSKLYPDL